MKILKNILFVVALCIGNNLFGVNATNGQIKNIDIAVGRITNLTDRPITLEFLGKDNVKFNRTIAPTTDPKKPSKIEYTKLGRLKMPRIMLRKMRGDITGHIILRDDIVSKDPLFVKIEIKPGDPLIAEGTLTQKKSIAPQIPARWVNVIQPVQELIANYDPAINILALQIDIEFKDGAQPYEESTIDIISGIVRTK